MKTFNKIPATPRSKYYKNLITGGSVSQIVTPGVSYVGTSGLPYSLDDNGDYAVDKGITLPFVTVGEKKIDSAKVITWDSAVVAMHSHSNKSHIDSINQDLSSTSVVEFAGIQNRGVLNMNGHNIWAVSNIDFNAYETDGEVKWNTIKNHGRYGFEFNNTIRASRGIELMGTNREMYSYNDDLWLRKYNSDWTLGSYLMLGGYAMQGNRLFLDDELKVGGNATIDKNLTVKGAFSCYELVVNKIRSTNGYLYVTDSTPVLQILYTGYNNLNQSEAKVKIEAGRLQEGDYVMMQKFTGDRIVKMTFYVSWAETIEDVFIVNQDGFGLEDLRAFLKVDDCLIKYDSTVEDRRTGILLSPYNGGYIDFYTGGGNGANRTITTSLGNLGHLNIPGINGYGLYSDNAHITGDITATNLKVTNRSILDNVVVRELKTADEGVKIEASGNSLRMLDADNQIKLLVTGDKYSTLNSFVSSSGSGGDYSIKAASKTYSANASTPDVSLTEYIRLLANNITVPQSGNYSAVIPTLKLTLDGQFNTLLTLAADDVFEASAGFTGFANMTVNLLLVDESTNKTMLNLGTAIVNLNKSNSYDVVTFNSQAVEVNVNNSGSLSLKLKVSVFAKMSAEYNESYSISLNSKAGGSGNVTLQELTNNTTIFENGLGYKASTTKYAVIINSDDDGDPVFEARNGQYALKVCSDGIKIMRNGVWSNL